MFAQDIIKIKHEILQYHNAHIKSIISTLIADYLYDTKGNISYTNITTTISTVNSLEFSMLKNELEDNGFVVESNLKSNSVDLTIYYPEYVVSHPI